MLDTLLGNVCFYSYQKGKYNPSRHQSQGKFVINFKMSSVSFSLLPSYTICKNIEKRTNYQDIFLPM